MNEPRSREVSIEEFAAAHPAHRFVKVGTTGDKLFVVDKCEACPDHVVPEDAEEKYNSSTRSSSGGAADL